MRLFIAINFEEKLKNSIQNIIQDIRKHSQKGRFVKNEHMHLTLEFLGEIPAGEVGLIEEAMEQISCTVFTLELSEIGCFKRRGGDIYWIGLKKNQSLFRMQRELHNLLLEKGFELESRKYNPHLTIGRKVVVDSDFAPDKYIAQLRGLNITVDKIDLMKSEHIDGKLKHTVIFSKLLH
ncbi:MAG: RNA 2',3'-cyclic phosphodiesterase [Natronincolaceae bacterium]|nr:RNA 2',3'-cyclic phosphodiesterase [Bacillota bacterium]NLK90635.1 RNA 2',3'-cyclic phosphodiesterase [Clostridiales bacterium]